jgi:hypothetical protein
VPNTTNSAIYANFAVFVDPVTVSSAVAAAKMRFKYTKGQTIQASFAVTNYTNNGKIPSPGILWYIAEPDSTQQLPNFVLHLVIDTTLLPSAYCGIISINQGGDTKTDEGDPALVFNGTGLFKKQNWDYIGSDIAPLTIGGLADVVLYNDISNQVGYLRVTCGSTIYQVVSLLDWSTGPASGMQVALHPCVKTAIMWWTDGELEPLTWQASGLW